MTRLKIVLLFISLFVWRWVTIESPLPANWHADNVVRVTIPIIEYPEYTDTSTIVREGQWYIRIPGYTEIIPGDLVVFEGVVEEQYSLNAVTRVLMKDATAHIVATKDERKLSLVEIVLIKLGEWRVRWVSMFEAWLAEPMASLASGILLGVRARMPTDFYDQLIATGTLHIVAASGYNVMIVATVLIALASKLLRRSMAIGVGILGVVLYVLIAGASASVVRAGIMGSLTLIAYYFGRPAEARRLLLISAGAMLLIHPLMLVDIGFQLSVFATAGILYLEPWIRARLSQREFLTSYLYPTLAATLSTAPVILYHFGRVSWISPLVNILILPLIPLIMGLSALAIGVGSLIPGLGQVFAWILYVPLWWVVSVIAWFG